MGVEKIVARPGNGVDFPKKHDEICVEYTGNVASILIPTIESDSRYRMAV